MVCSPYRSPPQSARNAQKFEYLDYNIKLRLSTFFSRERGKSSTQNGVIGWLNTRSSRQPGQRGFAWGDFPLGFARKLQQPLDRTGFQRFLGVPGKLLQSLKRGDRGAWLP